MTRPQMTWQRAKVLAWLSRNPGASAADIDRACRTARGGHQHMYAMVDRMTTKRFIARGPIRSESAPNSACGYYVLIGCAVPK